MKVVCKMLGSGTRTKWEADLSDLAVLFTPWDKVYYTLLLLYEKPVLQGNRRIV